jgi:hypothetical protein
MPLLKIRTYLINSGSFTGSLNGTSSYTRRALTASYALNASGGGGGSTLRTGSTYPITSSFARRAITASYALNTFFQTGSIVKQTILYNVVSGSQNVISGLSLGGNKWGVDIKEEWDAVGSGSGDTYYNSCSLLMHFDGANGSTTFTDNSPTPKTATANGNAQISTVQSKFGGASAYFDGTGDYLSISSNNDFAFGTGNFTVEAWIYRTGGSGNQPICQSDALGGSTNNKWWFAVVSTGLFFGTHDAGGFSVTTTTTFNTNTWYHVAVTRNSGTMYMFVNGVSTAFSTSGTPSGYSLSQNGFTIGAMSTPFYWTGYIDDLRITKGVARYTSNFTPPTSAFPNSATSAQYATKYIGLIGGLNDRNVDYGIQKLSDSSIKVVKMSQTTSPFPSGSLSASVNRVYVNVLDYTKVAVTSSYASRALTASYASGGGTMSNGRVYGMTLLFS